MIEIKSASNLAIDIAIAKLDQKNDNLSFGLIDGIFCGYFIEKEKNFPAVFMVGPGWFAQKKVKKNPNFNYATTYCPTYDWSQAKQILLANKVGFGFDESKNKWLSSVHKIEGDEPVVVALKDVLKSKYGDFLELDEETEKYIHSVATKT
jgi:hypothetical protein